MRKILKKVIVFALLVCLSFSTIACGGNNDGRVEIKFFCETLNNEKIAYISAVKTYNEGQGKIDGVYVNATYDVPSSNIGQAISSPSAQTPNVVAMDDENFKGKASLGYFLNLDEYLTPAVKEQMGWNDIPELMKNRYSYNTETDSEIGKKLAGKGSSVLGLPNGGSPVVLFYNKELLSQVGVNVVSVAETDLTGTGLKPHGYAEYTVAPVEGMTQSTNNAGDTVYKVFNDKIPMNWEEFRYLMKYLQNALQQCTYPYMSEYWFEYGWSVGGDCIGWDASQNEYVFTLNDKNANFLAVSDVTVNGVNYKAGDVLSYEDKEYLYANKSEITDAVYELPSMYEAFLEFNRIGVPKDKTTDLSGGQAIKGYGLAKTTLTNKEGDFKAGISPFVAAYYSQISEFQASNVKDKFDIAPQQQYREYEGGSLVDENDFDNIQVKVIGKTYEGVEYTGDLKTVNGTPIVGRAATHSLNYCIAIAKNSDSQKYDAAFKFASWLAGAEGQTLLAKGNGIIPNQTTVAYGSEFLNGSERIVANTWAAVFANENADMGDWAYFDEGSWVTAWADLLNTTVRQGTTTLTQFFNAKVNSANVALKNMGLKLCRR